MSDPKNIVLGITGGIAAYKGAELIRRLRDRGSPVRVVMTQAAEAFITPLTLQALSDQPVHRDLLDPHTEATMGHITLARWADAVVVAPATADFIARLAHGLADDLLTTLCLASDAPLVIVPAMNRLMWANPATQDNVRIIRDRGVHILGPASGSQACGEIGLGRMLEPEAIVAELARLWAPGILSDQRVLVTAGPTREAIDPVRYISNRSSGKMGFAVATAAVEAGAQVTLVAGPVSLATPPGVQRVDVESAQEMLEAVMARSADCDIYIGVAAVADYRPATTTASKIKKRAESITLTLQPTQDILAALAALPRRPFTVGFAAETERLEEYAEEKRQAKSLDMIAANRVDGPEGGFERDANALKVSWDGGRVDLPLAPKEELAGKLISLVAQRYERADEKL